MFLPMASTVGPQTEEAGPKSEVLCVFLSCNENMIILVERWKTKTKENAIGYAICGLYQTFQNITSVK